MKRFLSLGEKLYLIWSKNLQDNLKIFWIILRLKPHTTLYNRWKQLNMLYPLSLQHLLYMDL